jgi:segregation and condensation protein A
MSIEAVDDGTAADSTVVPGAKLRALREQRAGHADELHAIVAGESVTEMPTDLYIPPDALEVFLETFEGPLDLLLYLIRRENLDILDIKVAEITGST